MTTTRFVSLFAGVGGCCLGFEAAGLECAGQVEIDPHAAGVLANHWPDVPRHGDVTTAREWADAEGLTGTIDVVVGGFPCQDLSVAGRRDGLAGARSGLFWDALGFATHVGAGVLVLENVPGLLTSNGGRDFGRVLTALGNAGYAHVEWRVLDAQGFGVAQRRRRVFIVASVTAPNSVPVLSDGAGAGWHLATPNGKGAVAHDAFEWGRAAFWDGGQVTQTLDAVLHKKQCLPEKRRFPAVLVPAWEECEMGGDFWCVLHDAHASECECPALDEWDANPYHRTVLRYLTPLECERLQGFPDQWTAGQADTHRYKQLGNAVAVPVAVFVGRCVNRLTQQ